MMYFPHIQSTAVVIEKMKTNCQTRSMCNRITQSHRLQQTEETEGFEPSEDAQRALNSLANCPLQPLEHASKSIGHERDGEATFDHECIHAFFDAILIFDEYLGQPASIFVRFIGDDPERNIMKQNL